MKWLKTAFLLGAVTDALAIIPMLCPQAAKIMWGFEQFNGTYLFAMGYGSALMLGWTFLLVWAYQKPLERRIIALLTIIIIIGFIVTEFFTLAVGAIALNKLIPTWILQFILLNFFSIGYFSTRKKT